MKSFAIIGALTALLYVCVFGGLGASIAWLFDKDILTGFLIGAALPFAYFVWIVLVFITAFMSYIRR